MTLRSPRSNRPITFVWRARPLTLTVALALALLCFGTTPGCAPGPSSQVPPHATPTGLIEVPEHFLVGDPSGTQTREPAAGEGCRNPMVDPRDSTRITLARSSNGLGDYEVPDGRYGVRKGELLRLDCANGRVMGVVKR